MNGRQEVVENAGEGSGATSGRVVGRESLSTPTAGPEVPPPPFFGGCSNRRERAEGFAARHGTLEPEHHDAAGARGADGNSTAPRRTRAPTATAGTNRPSCGAGW